MDYILESKNLSKTFKNTLALNDVSLKIAKGKIIGLLGPNGSGKTTFIKLCNDLLTPTKGNILIDGMEPGVETKAIVSIFQRNYLNDWMKVDDILRMFNDFYKDFDLARAYDMLEKLHLNPEVN